MKLDFLSLPSSLSISNFFISELNLLSQILLNLYLNFFLISPISYENQNLIVIRVRT